MANPELGAKQICPNDQTKFYDLNRRPAVCPKCGLEFDPEEAVRSRRVRARAVTPDYEAEDEAEEKPREEDAEGLEEEVEATPEIDEEAKAEPPVADEGDHVGPAPPGEPDLGVGYEEEPVDLEEEDGEVVPFLEEEEDDPFASDDIEPLPEDDREDR